MWQATNVRDQVGGMDGFRTETQVADGLLDF
jgi:hypothetical protein